MNRREEIQMAFIEKFLGKRVAIPEDRYYHIKQGFWAKPEDHIIVFGITEPSLVLAGGVNDLDWLVENNDNVTQGQSVLFIITGKILYVDAPVGGVIAFNEEVKTNPSLISSDPYEKGWLFRIKPDVDVEKAIQAFGDVQQYLNSLQRTEGFKNPEGLKGGVSGICKAVYTGIREQKISSGN